MNLSKNSLVNEIVSEIRKEFGLVEKFEKQLFHQKVFRNIATCVLIFIVVGCTVSYFHTKSQLETKNEQITSLTKEVKILSEFLKNNDSINESAKAEFISYGDSLICSNKLSNLSTAERNILLNSIWTNSKEFNMNPYLSLFVVHTESNFIVDARSGHGAVGLFQFLPSTYKICAQSLHEEYDPKQLYDIQKQSRYAIYYLRSLYDDCEDIELALSRYNQGHTHFKNEYSKQIYSRYRGLKKESL